MCQYVYKCIHFNDTILVTPSQEKGYKFMCNKCFIFFIACYTQNYGFVN